MEIRIIEVLLYIQVHEQFVSHRELLANIRDLDGNFFCKVTYVHAYL